MKKYLISIALFAFFFTSCKNNSSESSETSTNSIEINDSTSLSVSDEELTSLNELKGKYPMEVQLLDNPLIKSRLEKLLGDEYSNFRKFWMVETPILIEDNILYSTGCEQHNCAANQYVLEIDLSQNNINVYHFGADVKSYVEKGTIQLPKGLSEEFEVLKSNRIY